MDFALQMWSAPWFLRFVSRIRVLVRPPILSRRVVGSSSLKCLATPLDVEWCPERSESVKDELFEQSKIWSNLQVNAAMPNAVFGRAQHRH